MQKTLIRPASVGFVAVAAILVLAGCGDKKEISLGGGSTGELEATEGTYVAYEAPADASAITGESCANYNKRAFAVMYSGDQSARQYFSNLSKADLVLEMPHRPQHGQPRIMGVFQCNTPSIVGPMRSGRTDHISVAASLDAIYVPWGGSSVGKSLLKQGLVDQIDCNGEIAPSGGAACFRRSGAMSQLEKASVDITKLISVAQNAGYRTESQTTGFGHQGDVAVSERPSYGKVSVKFQSPYNVEYQYDKDTNSYKRFIFGEPDIDFETKEQYAPKNLITIITKKESFYSETDYTALGLKDPWEGITAAQAKQDNAQYPNMQLGDPWFDTKFEGEAKFFFNGERVEGTWKREKGVENGFEFFDEEGNEVRFAPGQIWMHVLGHDKRVNYEDEEEYKERLEEEAEAAANPAAALL